MSRLAGKHVVVTGAGSGIGAGTAAVLADEGAKVACADIDLDAAKATAAGVDVTLVTVEDSVHVFTLFPFLPEARGTLAKLTEWSHRRVPPA